MKPPASVTIEPEYAGLFRSAGLEEFDGIMALPSPSPDVMKAGDGRITIRWTLGGRTFFLKRFRATRWAAQARNEWRMLHELPGIGVSCASPVALGERRSLLGVRDSFLITEKIPDAVSAYQWLKSNPPRRGELLEPLAWLASRFHAAGYCHKDFYLGHVFVREISPLKLFLIDLQRCQRLGLNRRRWVVKDLAALHYSLVIRAGFSVQAWEEFLARYGEVDSRMSRGIEAKSARIARHRPQYG